MTDDLATYPFAEEVSTEPPTFLLVIPTYYDFVKG